MSFPDRINTRRLVWTFLELARINSPSLAEAEIGSYLTKRFEGLGCDLHIQEYGASFNIIASKRGPVAGGPPLMLSAHMDTVEPTEGIVIHHDDTLIRSAGRTVLGADDKAAMAQIIEAMTVLRDEGIPHGDIEIVLTSAEEKGLMGARALDYGMLRSRHAIVLDSSGPVGGIIVGAPTHITYEMKITGRAAHAGIEPDKGLSAIRVAGRIVSSVADGRIDPVTTANIGVIAGGTATNVVPREVLIRGELRSHDAAALAGTQEEIFSAARRIAAEAGAGIDISEQEEYRAFRVPDDNAFLHFLAEIYRDCGMEPVVAVSGGGSDANIFNLHGITALNMSTGMQKVHSPEEFIMVEDLRKGALVLLQSISEFTQFRNR